MPNPLLPSAGQLKAAAMRALQPYNGRMTPPQTVEGQPVPAAEDVHEEARGPFLPYRGVENHGVPSEQPWQETPEGYTDGTHPVYDEHDPAANAINVRVIKDSAEQITGFRVRSFPIGPAVQQIASRNRARTKLTVKNMGPDTVYISDTDTAPMYQMFPIAANDKHDCTATEAVYAMSGSQNNCDLRMYIEYTVPA